MLDVSLFFWGFWLVFRVVVDLSVIGFSINFSLGSLYLETAFAESVVCCSNNLFAW